MVVSSENDYLNSQPEPNADVSGTESAKETAVESDEQASLQFSEIQGKEFKDYSEQDTDFLREYIRSGHAKEVATLFAGRKLGDAPYAVKRLLGFFIEGGAFHEMCAIYATADSLSDLSDDTSIHCLGVCSSRSQYRDVISDLFAQASFDEVQKFLTHKYGSYELAPRVIGKILEQLSQVEFERDSFLETQDIFSPWEKVLSSFARTNPDAVLSFFKGKSENMLIFFDDVLIDIIHSENSDLVKKVVDVLVASKPMYFRYHELLKRAAYNGAASEVFAFIRDLPDRSDENKFSRYRNVLIECAERGAAKDILSYFIKNRTELMKLYNWKEILATCLLNGGLSLGKKQEP